MFEGIKKYFGLNEAIEKTYLSNENKITSLDGDKNVDVDLSLGSSIGYFDDGSLLYYLSGSQKDNSEKQADLIKNYRKVAAYPEVSDAIDEIVNEMSFVLDNESCCFLGFKGMVLTDNIKDLMQSIFDETIDLLDLNTNIDVLCKRFYVDGQLAIGLSYDENTQIYKTAIMNPVNLVFNREKNIWYYNDKNGSGEDQFYRNEEIIRIDSGLYNEGLILSHLNSVIKIVNQLQTLEDLLIPLRFSRSVSRRVFNIDVGNLPYQKAAAAVEEIKNKIRYKKFYDPETGTISNNNSVTSIVEDFYFPSRNGTKGTSVDILEETGNLGETGDLDYFKNKLYNALKVPTARLMGENKTVFDFSSTSIETSEIKFFAFINRLRQRFNPLIIELMKRVAVSKNMLTEKEFEKYAKQIFVGWEKESNFLERQRIDILKQRLELYSQFKEFEGTVYSRKYLLENVLKMSDEEIEEMRAQILEEGSNVPEEDFGSDENVDELADEMEKDEFAEENMEEEPVDEGPQMGVLKKAKKANTIDYEIPVKFNEPKIATKLRRKDNE